MPSLPREWTFDTIAAGGLLAAIVVPASPGIVHVLTSVKALLRANGTGLYQPSLLILNGATNIFTWSMGVNAPAGALDTDTFDFPLTKLTNPGNSLTVEFSAVAPAGGLEQLIITGYSI